MLTLSAIIHAALAAMFLWVFAPRAVEQQSAAQAEMALTTLNVPRNEATEQTPAADLAQSETLPREGIGTQPIPRTDAAAVRPESPAAQTLAPDTEAAQLDALRQPALPAANPTSTTARADTPDQTILIAAEPHSVTPLALDDVATNLAPNLRPISQTLDPSITTAPKAGEIQTRGASLPEAIATLNLPTHSIDVPQTPAISEGLSTLTTLLRVTEPQLALLNAVQPNASNVAVFEPNSNGINAVQPDVTVPVQAPAQGAKAPQKSIPSERAPTVLAWSGDLSLQIPQSTIDTAAALRVPNSGADQDRLRDALANRLNGVDCARVQTIYDPETGTINLRGHVKTDADRTELIDALAQQLGNTLPIQDRLQRLDAPQCDVLVRLADMPLPQSVEQLTNPLIIGADLQARTYTFNDGQTMIFDLAGADYNGWLYLDYFDNEGQVLHLIPNEFIPPLQLDAEAPLAFGSGGVNDPANGKFEMRVSPPFGQDIAVAMVSNQPLFDTVRQTVEPAEPYLKELANRVETLRRTRPDFKGEWVYLFVETRSSP
ncbi:DUF4384 domain-containing protein [Rhodobacteraceae bacterium]|nr:DUF4384 domain-containing protein [Paracoccaceae bacterium]